MRFVAYLALTISIAFIPGNVYAAGTVMGGFTCREVLPCDQADANFPSTDQLMSLANQCVGQNIGVSAPSATSYSFFTTSGVDGNGCFATNPVAFPGVDGLRSLPQCCVKELSPGQCYIHCTMISR
jgi:hypothetical protein